MNRRNILGIIIIFLSVSFIYAAWESFFPYTKDKIGEPIKCSFVCSFKDETVEKIKGEGQRITLDDKTVLLRFINGSFVLSNTDAQPKWSSVFMSEEDLDYGRTVISRSDLDKNGKEDLILFRYGVGSGIAASFTYFKVFMFDEAGLPVPFVVNSFTSGSDDAYDDFCNTPNDNKPGFFNMWFNDGYWVTTLYRTKDARWYRQDGVYEGIKLPCYTRFLEKGSKKPTTLKKGKKLYPPDFSNDKPLYSGRILEAEIKEMQYDDKLEIVLEQPDGKKLLCYPDMWFSTGCIVEDDKDMRVITFYDIGKEKILEKLKTIKGSGKVADFYGSRDDKENNPEIIWIKTLN